MKIIILFCISCAVFSTLGETKKINEDQSLAVELAYNLDRVPRASQLRQSKPKEKEEIQNSKNDKDPDNNKKKRSKKNQKKKEKLMVKESKRKSMKESKRKSMKESKKKSIKQKKNGGDKKGSKKGKKGKGQKKNKNTKKIKGKKTRKTGTYKNAGISKQDTCYADLLAKTKKFVLYFYQSQKLNRITSWVKLAQNKKAKALSTFSPARDALGTSTNQGTSCAGNSSALGAANTTYTTLVSCNTTASTICDVSLNATSDTLVTSCTTALATYIADFRACLKTGACSCFQGLEEAGAECENFLTLENQIKAEKNDCINPDKTGSFGNCRQEERLATTFTVECCASNAVTTQAPGRRRMRLNLNKLFHN